MSRRSIIFKKNNVIIKVQCIGTIKYNSILGFYINFKTKNIYYETRLIIYLL